VAKQVLIIFAANNGFLTEFPVDSLGEYEKGVYLFAESKDEKVWTKIREDKKFGKKARTDAQSEVTAEVVAILEEYSANFRASREEDAAAE
jgi:F-type H+-transporting ATPase subunit alpha